VLGRELGPGSTILIGRKEDEAEVDIRLIPGGAPPEPEKVTVPPEEPSDALGEAGDKPVG
jgi:hypothetical protein